jgi:tripartite-type tricarboxylate transporter receptor subunit TctC
MKNKFSVIITVMLILSLVLSACAGNQSSDSSNFPKKQITYSLPFEPGGQSDIEARRQQPFLEEMLGQKFVVTYKPGGGGAVGWAELKNKKPDGYFLSGINIPHIVLQPLSSTDTGYTTEDITPIAIFQATPIGLAVAKDSDIKTLEDYIAKAKANPGTITVAGSGSLSGHHMAKELFDTKAGIVTQYVPFTGAAPSVQAFLGNNTDAILMNSNDLLVHKDSINILAIGSEKTFEPLPDAPTFIEKGYDMTAGIDRGIGGPPGMDPEIIKILEKAFLDIVNKPEIQKQMYEEAFEPKFMGHEDSKKYIAKKVEEYKPIVEILNK